MQTQRSAPGEIKGAQLAEPSTTERSTAQRTEQVPVADLKLVTFSIDRNAGTRIELDRAHIGTIYESRTKSYEVLTSRPGPLGKLGRITAEAESRLNEGGAENQEVIGSTRNRGIPTVRVRSTASPSAPGSIRTPDAATKINNAEIFSGLKPPRMPISPSMGIAAAFAAEAIGNVILGKPETREEKAERARKEEEQVKARREAALAEFRAMIEKARAGADSQNLEANARATRAESMASSASVETIKAATAEAQAIETGPTQAARAEATADTGSHIAIIESYRSRGAEGQFKSLVAEALTANEPSEASTYAMEILGRTEEGKRIIDEVRSDLAATAEEALPYAADELIEPETFPAAAREERDPFEELSFSAELRRYNSDAHLAALAA